MDEREKVKQEHVISILSLLTLGMHFFFQMLKYVSAVRVFRLCRDKMSLPHTQHGTSLAYSLVFVSRPACLLSFLLGDTPTSASVLSVRFQQISAFYHPFFTSTRMLSSLLFPFLNAALDQPTRFSPHLLLPIRSRLFSRLLFRPSARAAATFAPRLPSIHASYCFRVVFPFHSTSPPRVVPSRKVKRTTRASRDATTLEHLL